MIVALAVIALAVGTGAVIAVSARDLRIAVLGLAVVVVGWALLTEPVPSPVILAVRVVAGLLVVGLLWAAVSAERTEPDRGSPLGWPAEALIGICAAFGGLGIAATVAAAAFTGIGASPGALGGGVTAAELIAMAASTGIVLGAGPALLATSIVRRGIGAILVIQGVIGLRISLAGPPAELEQLIVAGLLVACAATGLAIAMAEGAAAGSPDHARR